MPVSGGGSKPGERRGGRQKGTPNKISGDIKAMTLEALSAEGGVEYLREQARKNPTSFMSLLGRILPLQVKAEHSGLPILEEIVNCALMMRQRDAERGTAGVVH